MVNFSHKRSFIYDAVVFVITHELIPVASRTGSRLLFPTSNIFTVNKPVMIAHGVSSPQAIGNMLHLAVHIIESRLIEHIKQAFELQDA